MGSPSPQVLSFSSQPHILKIRKPSVILKPDMNICGLGLVMPAGGLVCASTESLCRSRFECQREPLYSDPQWRKQLLTKMTEIAYSLNAEIEGSIWPSCEGVTEGLSIVPSAINANSSNREYKSSNIRQLHRILLTGATKN